MTVEAVDRESHAASPALGLDRDRYVRLLALVALVTFGFRAWFGSRGSFTGDDFFFRALVSEDVSPATLFVGHSGHLSPLGLFIQWLSQQAFPGAYVPLMICSAALVGLSQVLIGIWAALVFGYRWIGLFASLIAGWSLMLLELATWWSVALYAAPLVAATALLVLASTRLFLGRGKLPVTLFSFGLCLLSSSKAIVVPVLVVAIAASYPLGRSHPLGYRRALRQYGRLWLGMAVMVAAYAVLFAARRGPLATGDPTLAELGRFVTNLWRFAWFPSIWGGPWTWASPPGGFHVAPAPTPVAMTASAAAIVVASCGMLLLRPLVWRILVGCGLYVLLSSVLTALGRAGTPFGAPVMRYTFDLLLPALLVLCLGAAPTRWETNPWSPAGRRLQSWLAARATVRTIGAALLATTWCVSCVASYSVPVRILPLVTMKSWVANVRQHYDQLSGGLLEQPAPASIVLFPEPLSTFLAGDPGAPQVQQVVTDRLLGFDGEGRLIELSVQGVSSLPGQGNCPYQATGDQPAAVPLQEPVPAGRHTVAFDYLLSMETPVSLAMEADPTTGILPVGLHRAYFIVDGSGSTLTATVGAPGASLCVLSATVGWPMPGPLVDPSSL